MVIYLKQKLIFNNLIIKKIVFDKDSKSMKGINECLRDVIRNEGF
jgi:hypothetical protein